VANGFIQIQKHTLQKYNILRKYFEACLKFEKIYKNFAYIDTHGGSGKVLFEGQQVHGSPLIAAESKVHPECYAIEIDEERRLLLRKAVSGIPNIKIIGGDCNKEIGSLLRQIENWKFTFCFLDPDGLVYPKGATKYFQLTWATIEEISRRTNSELLVNLRSQDILRCMGLIDAEPEKASKVVEDITALLGTDLWTSKRTRYKIRDFFLDRLQSIGFTYLGCVNIKSEGNSHQYYLIYASHHEVGAKIMNSNFKMEWGFRPLVDPPLQRFIYDDIAEQTTLTSQSE
jgi:three-Cys-motif partner protein